MPADRAPTLTGLRRALLRQPVITLAANPHLYRDIAGRHDQLARWFRERLGWPLVHDTTDGVIRLRITPAHTRHGRIVHARPAHPTMTRLGWTTAMLVCAALAESDRADVFATDLRETVTGHAAGDDRLPDLNFVDDHTHRLALAAALGWLERTGVLSFRAGSAEDVRDGQDAIITVRAAALRELLTCPTRPAVAVDADDLLVDPTPRGADTGVARRIVLDHAVYDADLPDDEAAWLRGNLAISMPWLHRLAADLGCEVERRADGVALIDTDPADPLAPIAFPAAGSTDGHIALILAEHLADALRSPHHAVPRDHLIAVVADHATAIGAKARWRADARDPANAPATTTRALSVLADFDLITVDRDTGAVTGRPLIARFGAEPVALTDPTPPQPVRLPLEDT